ncbi:MAG: protein kinase domain-containing protein [Candidatus Promineifilaceae bacterium]
MNEKYPYSFGKYRIESEIGRGSFGTVYHAVDTLLKRPVALKLLDPIYMRDRPWSRRFRREAIVMARLEHPHIVSVYDTGEQDGRLFIAMQLIAGSNLAELLQTHGPLNWERAVALMTQLASALDYAHQTNIVHRDLKPANILIHEDRATLTDFGLARIVESNSQSMTTNGGVAGTYQYMAPELFNDEEPRRSTDIYALGCILYEMVTAQVLFGAGTTAAVISAHLKPLKLQHEFGNDVPQGLADILQIALAKEPAERYQSGRAFAKALNNIAIARLAEPYAELEQLIVIQKQVIELELSDTSYAPNKSPNDAELHSHTQTNYETETHQQRDSDDSQMQQFESRIGLIRQYNQLTNAVNGKRWRTAQLIAEQIISQDSNFRDVPARLATINAHIAKQKTPNIQSNSLSSPTIWQLMAMTALIIIIGSIATILYRQDPERVAAVETNTPTATLERSSTAIKTSPTINATQTKDALLTNAATKTPTPVPSNTVAATQTPTITPTPAPVAIRADNAARVQQVHRLGKGAISSVAYSPDGALIAVSGSLGIFFYDAETLTEVRHIETTDWTNTISFSPDGTHIASDLGASSVGIWRVSDGSLLHSLEQHTDWVRSVAFSPDGSLLASGSSDDTVKLWRVSDGALLHSLEQHTSSVNSVAFSPDGHLLASASIDGTVRLWGVEEMKKDE